MADEERRLLREVEAALEGSDRRADADAGLRHPWSADDLPARDAAHSDAAPRPATPKESAAKESLAKGRPPQDGAPSRLFRD